MAKVYLKALKPFTRRLGVQTMVGHPEHRDVRGRYLEVEDSDDVQDAIDRGQVERVTQATYRKQTDTTERADAGERRIAQTAGKPAKLSATASSLEIAAAARALDVDLSKHKNRGAQIKAVNAAIADQGNVEPEEVEGTDNKGSAMAGLTRDSTSHPATSSPHLGTATQPAPLAGEEIEAPEDAAPTGGEGSETKTEGAPA